MLFPCFASENDVRYCRQQVVGILLQDKVAKWWLPDDVVFVKDLPRTATGKVSKLLLREQFKNNTLLTV